MIKKTIIITVIILVSWSLFLNVNKNLRADQSQWKMNTSRAQSYLYNNSDTLQNLIIGTSLSQKMDVKDFPHFFNLAFAGLSIYDGLAIMQAKKKLPEYVFIETNFPMLEESTDFYEKLLDPIPFYLKKYIPVLRDDRSPIPIFMFVVYDKFLKRNMSPVSDTFFQTLLNKKISDYSVKPDSIILSNQMEKLNQYVTYLEKKNVKIIFYEVPVNSALTNLPYLEAGRKAIHAKFPPQNYNYIDIPDESYRTTDGIHLSEEELKKYKEYFKNKYNNYCKKLAVK